MPVLPADPAAVCAYLTERAAQGASAASIELSCAALGNRHRGLGLPDPFADPVVRQVRRGLRRTLGSRSRRLAHPLDLDDIHRLLTAIDRRTTTGARDAAVILLGFASALRISELASLALDDVETRPTGVLLRVRGCKTDPDVNGQVVGVAAGRHRATDPVAALDAWLARRGRAPGPLFTSMRAAHPVGDVTLDPLSRPAIARMLRRRASAADLPADRITGHSLRAGHATTAALAGVSLDRIAAQTRHKTLAVLIDRYIRPVEALAYSSSRNLGL